MFKVLGVSGLLLFFSSASIKAQPLNSEDLVYLQRLAKDTYRCISTFVDPATGLPLDNSKLVKDAHTSVTNIGFYMASVIGAVELGLEDRPAALSKMRRVLEAVSRFQTWKNFPTNWTHTSRLSRHAENFVSSVDLGNYYAGVIVARQYFPELAPDCDKLLAVNWKYLYNPKKKHLYGGYNIDKSQYTDWYYENLGGDSRLASFLAIVMSGVPAESWAALERVLEERCGAEYLKPGWDAGGLFLGYMSGLFIEEKGTLPGLSAANFAKAQMLHMRKLGSPVWGWSASDSPKDGYLGFYSLKDNIVAPYASALAVGDFSREVVQNFRTLEDLGVRAPHLLNGKYVAFGFRDAYDIRTRQVTQNYLMLDQTMIFLSLVNFLKDNAVRKLFESYPPVRQAKAQLSDYKTSEKVDPGSYPVSLSRHFKLRVVPYDLRRPDYYVMRSSEIPLLNEQEWERSEILTLGVEHIETGRVTSEKDLGADVSFLWDPEYLYLKAKVRDQSLQVQPSPQEIYKGDLVEIYVNPDSQGLIWGNPKDFQIGVSPPFDDGEFSAYMWFQNRKPLYEEMRAVSKRTEDGYQIICAISWKLLKISKPLKGQSVGVSVAVNDIDEGRQENTKINWFFQPKEGKFILGRLILK